MLPNIPEIVLIETLNQCNRKCSFCKFGIVEEPPNKQLLDIRYIKKIARELGSINFNGRISPFHINEPLLDKRIGNIILLFREECPDAHISIVTNGDLLNDYTLDVLLNKGLDTIGISIYDDNSFNKHKHLIGEDDVVLIDMRKPRYIENRAGSINGTFVLPIDKPCARPSNMCVINSNGDIVLCCADMFAEKVLGNIKTTTLLDIWNSPEFVYLRNQLKTSRHNITPCSKCSHSGTTSSMNYPLSSRQKTII